LLELFDVLELQNKVDELSDMYGAIKAETESRNAALEQTLGVSEKFWDNLNNIVGTLKELQETLGSQDSAVLEPEAIREQQEVLDVRNLVLYRLSLKRGRYCSNHYDLLSYLFLINNQVILLFIDDFVFVRI
jgi:hypothetical protein